MWVNHERGFNVIKQFPGNSMKAMILFFCLLLILTSFGVSVFVEVPFDLFPECKLLSIFNLSERIAPSKIRLCHELKLISIIWTNAILLLCVYVQCLLSIAQVVSLTEHYMLFCEYQQRTGHRKIIPPLQFFPYAESMCQESPDFCSLQQLLMRISVALTYLCNVMLQIFCSSSHFLKLTLKIRD